MIRFVLALALLISLPAFAEVKQVTECSGWGLCLDSLVAARNVDLGEEGFGFPYRMDAGVVNEIDNLYVNDACKGVFLDTHKNMYCSADGTTENAFMIGVFKSVGMDETSLMEFITFDFETPGRAKLYHETAADVYYLEILAEQ